MGEFINVLKDELEKGTEFLRYDNEIKEYLNIKPTPYPSHILEEVMKASKSRKYNIFPTDLLEYRKEENHTLQDEEPTLWDKLEDEIFALNNILQDIYTNKFKNDPDEYNKSNMSADSMIKYYIKYLTEKYGNTEEKFKYSIISTTYDNAIINKMLILVKD